MLASPSLCSTKAQTPQDYSQPDIRTGHHLDNAAKLELLIYRAQDWAVAATVITTCINDMSAKNSTDMSEMMLSFVPREPAILQPLRTGLMQIDLHRTLVDELIEAYDLISDGGNLISAYAQDAREIGYERASVIHKEVLKKQWRLACAALNNINTGLINEVANAIHLIYSENWRDLQPLLITAKDGGTPCLVDGKLYYPDLPQRRRGTRVGLLQACEVAFGARTISAFARDISESGIGMERCQVLPIGTPVNVKLALGRQLSGHVVWGHSNMMGISLSQHLHPSDPLLFG